jgi:periplasmic divalent cation tolerance protein
MSTFSGRKEAGRVVDMLLKNRLIACANIIPAVESRYWWKGRIEKGKEALVVIKTRKSLVGKVIAEIKKNHSYTVSEVIELPILKGNKDYLKWIEEVTR